MIRETTATSGEGRATAAAAAAAESVWRRRSPSLHDTHRHPLDLQLLQRESLTSLRVATRPPVCVLPHPASSPTHLASLAGCLSEGLVGGRKKANSPKRKRGLSRTTESGRRWDDEACDHRSVIRENQRGSWFRGDGTLLRQHMPQEYSPASRVACL